MANLRGCSRVRVTSPFRGSQDDGITAVIPHPHGRYMRAAADDPIAAQIEAEVANLVRQRQEHEVIFYSWREPYKSLVAAKQAEVRSRGARRAFGPVAKAARASPSSRAALRATVLTLPSANTRAPSA